MNVRAMIAAILGVLAMAFALPSQPGKAQTAEVAPAQTGAQTSDISHPMSALVPTAVFAVAGRPDWVTITQDAVWVASSNVNHVVRLDPGKNRPGMIVTVAEPCAGMAEGFGSLWIPSCGEHAVVRVDLGTGKIQAKVAVSPADDEGGIAAGAGSVWIVASKDGDLVRIDPVTNAIQAHVRIPPGSFNPLFANGFVWITSNANHALLRVNPSTNTVTANIPVGPAPRFLTAGAGSVWVLNQGDGTITRVDASTAQPVATIAAAIPGKGGEIFFGAGAVWATVFGVPITCVNPETNRVIGQWRGSGGDSIRVGHGSLWLTDLKGGKVMRFPIPAVR